MSKHTKGPWFTRYCDDDYHQCMTVISNKNYGPSNTGLYDDASDTIAIVYHQLSPYVGTNHRPDEHDANVKLITAAPELLEVLEAIIERWDTPLWKDVPHTATYINAARLVVAKAKGE